MTAFRLSFCFMAFGMAIISLPSLSLAQQAPPPSQTPPSKNIPLPTGPFASWPPETREPAIISLRFRCAIGGVMAFGTYTGPKEAAIDDAKALMSACVLKTMPDDWPGREAEREQIKIQYEAAKKLDPNIPDPDLMTKNLHH